MARPFCPQGWHFPKKKKHSPAGGGGPLQRWWRSCLNCKQALFVSIKWVTPHPSALLTPSPTGEGIYSVILSRMKCSRRISKKLILSARSDRKRSPFGFRQAQDDKASQWYFAFSCHSERNEMQSKNLKVDVSTSLNMTIEIINILLKHELIAL